MMPRWAPITRRATGSPAHGLYTDIRGDAAAPALLFLHGGPGQGCHDFMALQGDLLGRSLRLIGLDQRGVDRSAPMPGEGRRRRPAHHRRPGRGLRGGAEGVRHRALGGGWASPSAAARAAVRGRPSRAASAVIFENPVWDLAASARAALPPIAAMLTERGRQDAALAALAAAAGDRPPARCARPTWRPCVPLATTGSRSSSQARTPGRGWRRSGRRTSGPDGSAGDEGSMRHHLAIVADPASEEPVQRPAGRPARPPAADRRRSRPADQPRAARGFPVRGTRPGARGPGSRPLRAR